MGVFLPSLNLKNYSLMKYLYEKAFQKNRMIVYWALIFLLAINSVHATIYPPLSYLAIEKGLSNNVVRCIYQDHNGFMWFGTHDGLNRYDGYEFKIFRNKQNDPNSLVHNIISAVTEDDNHNLWIGTRQGINRYNNLSGAFTAVSYRVGANKPIQKLTAVVRDVKVDKGNNIVIGTEGLGLLFCRNGASEAMQIPMDWSGKDVYNYGIQAIKIDKHNRIWVIVQNRGLGYWIYGR